MAHREALKGPPDTGGVQNNTSQGDPARIANGGPGGTSKVVLRAGIWYAGDDRCRDYREALKKALLAAGIAKAPPKRKKGIPFSRPPRLEKRPWWDAFVRHRAEREARKVVDCATFGTPRTMTASGGGGE